jgi:hypothetical protein
VKDDSGRVDNRLRTALLPCLQLPGKLPRDCDGIP